MDFWISVCGQFEVSEQLSTLISILKFLLQLPDDKDDGEDLIPPRNSSYLFILDVFYVYFVCMN